MKTIDSIIFTLDRFPKGFVFTYSDFYKVVKDKETVVKSLNRLASSGKISKLTKGKFFKSEISSFGSLPPSQYQIVKDLLEKKGKIIGYITCYSAYNELGLTSQVSNTIQIGRNDTKPQLKRGIYKIAFIKQKNKITKDNIPLLKILDSLRFIKNIPDTTINNSCSRLISIINGLDESEIDSLIRLSLLYPNACRALLGAILEKINPQINTDSIRKTLNPLTVYKLQVSESTLPTAINWNIK